MNWVTPWLQELLKIKWFSSMIQFDCSIWVHAQEPLIVGLVVAHNYASSWPKLATDKVLHNLQRRKVQL